MDDEQKVQIIKSVFRRLKSGESKTEIFREYRGSVMRKQIENQLTNAPTGQNRKRFQLLNWLLLICMISAMTIRFYYFSNPELTQRHPLLLRIFLIALLALLPFMVFKFHRIGYHITLVWILYAVIQIAPRYQFFCSTDGPLVVNTFFGLAAAAFLLAAFLRIKLFPNSGFFGIKRDPDGTPIFEN